MFERMKAHVPAQAIAPSRGLADLPLKGAQGSAAHMSRNTALTTYAEDGKIAREPAQTGTALADIWTGLGRVQPGPQSQFPNLGDRSEAALAPEFDILRTEVLQVLRSKHWTRIGVVAPSTGCGTTFTALNLAAGLARIEDYRTVLVDLNQRRPGLARLLDIPWKGAVGRFLAGDHDVSRYVRKLSENLGLVMNAEVSQNAGDILHSPRAQETLDDLVMTLDPDVMIFDLPPMLEHDDFTAFARTLDAVILVTDGAKTSPTQIRDCERKMAGIVPLLGVVLNKGRP